MNPSNQWLTARRLRIHALLLGIALWSVYIWTLSTPGLRDRNSNLKGTDFVHFYTLGALANAHDGAHLYDMDVQSALIGQRVSQAAGILYLPLYPPQVSLLFGPLARLPYAAALAFWWIISALLFGICCFAFWQNCPNLGEHGFLALTLAVAFPPFFNLIAWGQTSALALCCFTLAFLSFNRQREFAAGLALGMLVFKPQLGLAAAILFVAMGSWKVVFGAALSGVAQLSAGVFYYGIDPLQRWLQTLVHARSVLVLLEPRPYQTHCLCTFWSMLIPWNSIATSLYAVTAVAVMIAVGALWKKGGGVPLSLRFSALLLATVLISPHLTVYDLVVLAPAILLLADWAVEHACNRNRIGALLYLVYALPLLGPLARFTHVQLSVIAMVILVLVLWRISRTLGSATSGMQSANSFNVAVSAESR